MARPAPARASRTLLEQRIEEIASRMRSLRWERGRTSREFASAWGISEDRVSDLAAEASRRVGRELRTPDEVRDMLQRSLERALRRSWDIASRARADGELRDEIAAIRAIADLARSLGPLVGASAPTRVEVGPALPATREAMLKEAADLAGEVVAIAQLGSGDHSDEPAS